MTRNGGIILMRPGLTIFIESGSSDARGFDMTGVYQTLTMILIMQNRT